MKENLKFTLLIIGILVSFFIMGREVVETRAKLRKAQDEMTQEKKENIWLHDELKATKGELDRRDRDLRSAMNKLDFVNKKIALLRGDNTALASAKKGLEYKIAMLTEERRIIEAKFRSLRELKKAIRQVKLEIRDDRIRQRQEYIRQQKELDKWETALGNRGFLTKDGVHYYKPKVNVEVRPAGISLNKK
jgi:uncharacterized protein (DUF3084 family)